LLLVAMIIFARFRPRGPAGQRESSQVRETAVSLEREYIGNRLLPEGGADEPAAGQCDPRERDAGGAVDVADALRKIVEWARAQEDHLREGTLSTAFDAAARRDVDATVAAVESLMVEEPERAADYGRWLVSALSRAGEFERAAAFADSGSDAARYDWLTLAFKPWAAVAPESALDGCLALEDPERRRTALHAVFSGWAASDPLRLVEAASAFPPGPERDFALLVGLRAWRGRDPVAVENWLAMAGPLVGSPVALDYVRED
jgi:hypothetical protein